MPYILENLIIDRVDFVQEGANSAAFIEVCKRKEQTEYMTYSEILSKLKPEHASIIQQEIENISSELTKARNEASTASETAADYTNKYNEVVAKLSAAEDKLAKSSDTCACDGEADDDGVCKACGKPKKGAGFDETEVLKAMPEAARAEYIKMRTQKEAAEEQVRKAAEAQRESEAIAKAATLKSLPVEQSTLVEVLKTCDQSVIDILATVAAAIDGSVLTEVGKSGAGNTDTDAWSKIEAEADKVAARDSVTKQKAIGTVIKEHPELYREYLNGGKN